MLHDQSPLPQFDLVSLSDLWPRMTYFQFQYVPSSEMEEELITKLCAAKLDQQVPGRRRHDVKCLVKPWKTGTFWGTILDPIHKSCSAPVLYPTMHYVQNGVLWEICLMQWCSITHWGWVTHICVSNLTIIASDNGLSPGRHQAIIWTSAGILLFGTIGTNFNEILSEIHIF